LFFIALNFFGLIEIISHITHFKVYYQLLVAK